MRIFILSLLTLTLVGCARDQSADQQGCARSAETEISFSNFDAPDRVSARTDGPSCAEAVATLTIRNSEGKLLWVFSAPYRNLAGAASYGPDGFAPTPDQVDEFMASWADLTLAKTSALPAWPENATHLTGGDSGLSYATDLPREAYELLRARDLPEACFAVSTEGSECIIMAPATNEAISMVRFGP